MAVADARPGSKVAIVLTKGAAVIVRVNDPNKSLSTHEGKTQGAHLLLGIEGDDLSFTQADVVLQDSAGRTYQILIPFDRAIRIAVASAFFQLSDETGKALPRHGLTIPVSIPAGRMPLGAAVVLNVTGAGG